MANISTSIKGNLNGIIAIIISFALLPALLSGIEQAKRYMTGTDLSFLDKLMVERKRKRKKEFLLDLDGPGTDMAEACLMANFVEQELLLRDGRFTIEELADCERQVFLRTTLAHPVNILATPFIHKEE